MTRGDAKRRTGRPAGPISSHDRRCTLYANEEWWSYLEGERDRRRLAGERSDWSTIVIDGLTLLKSMRGSAWPAAPAGGWGSATNCVQRVGIFLPRPWSTYLVQETVARKVDQTTVLIAGLAALKRMRGPRGKH